VPASRRGSRAISGPSPLPRPLLVLGAPIVALAAIGFFVLLGFPYDRYRESLAAEMERASGAAVSLGELSFALGTSGPALSVAPVRMTWPAGLVLELSRARVRPALSLAWLGGDPALALDLAGPTGAVRGTLSLLGPAFDGRLRDVDLARLPLADLLPGASLEGKADAEADLSLAAEGPLGQLTLRAREGSIAVPDLPVAIPYQTLDGALRFEEGALVVVDSLTLEGPLLALSLTGRIGSAPDVERAPLALQGELTVREEAVRGAALSLGVPLDAAGHGRFEVAGTLGAPFLQ
jgi:type II secretion system protein N